MSTKKPWLDSTGKPYCDAVLQIASLTWNEADWEQYLASLEFQPRSDQEISVGNYRFLEDNYTGSLADLLPESAHLSDELIEDVKSAIEELPPRQRLAVEEEIYLGKTQRVVSQDMGITRKSLNELKVKADSKLKKRLTKYRPV